MTPVLLAALLIAAQSTAVHSMLANIQEARGGVVLPSKIGAAIGAIEELGPIISAESAAVLDAETGVMLWGKRPSAVRPIASITKLATALTIVRDGVDLGAVIEIVPTDIPEEGHTVFQPGDRVTMDDLLTAMLVYSDNAAARALVRTYAYPLVSPPLSEGEPVEVSSSIRLADPAGLSPENRGTAIDAARLLMAALRAPAIADRLRMSRATIDAHRPNRRAIAVKATNLLLRDGTMHTFAIVGGKTGYLDESGHNLVMAAERKNHRIIIALLGSASNDDRFRDARILADWVFRNYEWKNTDDADGSSR
jgi:D-alanyl-D-alanine endopeptidase (penicillin-binding protein 7)